jgi:5,10-methylenetetrahydromethanopterin reductase
LEFFIFSSHIAGETANTARQLEKEGFDGVCFGDTQCISANAYVNMTAAACATTRLKVMVGVTNPVTRDSSVTASAAASVQLESGGRAVLGIGRGDSAVHKIGRKAATAAEFERYLIELQGYLSGESVDRDGIASRIGWLKDANLPKVPVDVAAPGPGVLAAGARQAERLSLNLGGDPERIARGIDEARKIRRAAGKSVDTLTFGTYMPIAPHPDIRVARDLVKGVTAVYTRFQAMKGYPADQIPPEDARVVKNVGQNYDNTAHGRGDASHTKYLEDDYVDRFSVVGPPEKCIERLRKLRDAGLDRIMLVGPNRLMPEAYEVSRRLLVEAVLPEMRR